MNFPNMGITRDDPGKCVLGTVPVEQDGSAHFRVPAGVIVFFQALDEHGMAIQTMKTTTHVQPGQVLGCVGCHEHRMQTAPARLTLAMKHEPSKITPGPEGSWPFRFDRLVQPVLDQQCTTCHKSKSQDTQAARLDLTSSKSYENLIAYGKPSLQDQVWNGYRQGFSVEGQGIAATSTLTTWLKKSEAPCGAKLSNADWERLITWMDTYAQRLGAFDIIQEQALVQLRIQSANLLQKAP